MRAAFSPEPVVRRRPPAFPVLLALFLVCAAFSPAAAEEAGGLFPDEVFGGSWKLDGKASRYGSENLYVPINGEAELFFPYGFEVLDTATYAKQAAPGTAVTCEVFRMASLLDAFGIYSNYLDPEAPAVPLGAGAFALESQLMFYQDRYFVRLSVSGSTEEDPSVFRAFGEMIAAKIPGGPSRPRELDFLKVPGAVEKTEKYIAASVIGYPFFRRGMVVEVAVGNGRVKAFVLLHSSVEEAGQSLEAYLASLRDRGVQPDLRDAAAGTELFARDPLYGGLILRRSSTFLVGAARVASAEEGRRVLDALQSRLPAGR